MQHFFHMNIILLFSLKLTQSDSNRASASNLNSKFGIGSDLDSENKPPNLKTWHTPLLSLAINYEFLA